MEVIIFDKELEEFITSLEKNIVAKVLRTIDLLEKSGNQLGFPHSKKVGKVFELRVRGKQEIRIFYVFYDKKAILLHGFIKKSQKIPKKEWSKILDKLKQLDSL